MADRVDDSGWADVLAQQAQQPSGVVRRGRPDALVDELGSSPRWISLGATAAGLGNLSADLRCRSRQAAACGRSAPSARTAESARCVCTG